MLTNSLFMVAVFGPFVLIASIAVTIVYMIASKQLHKPVPKQLFLKVVLVSAVIFALGFYIFDYYDTHRSGSLNPYTQQCIGEGYRGAYGDHCTN